MSKAEALKKKTEKSEHSHKLKKTHHSVERCRHCGEVTSKSTRHESGHREYDCVDAPGEHMGVKIVR